MDDKYDNDKCSVYNSENKESSMEEEIMRLKAVSNKNSSILILVLIIYKFEFESVLNDFLSFNTDSNL